MTFRLRPEAESDIEAIASYISEDSPAAARRWFEDIFPPCQKPGDMPKMGVARPEVRPDVRTFPHGNYLVVYREIDGGVDIVRILHGARKWQELL